METLPLFIKYKSKYAMLNEHVYLCKYLLEAYYMSQIIIL